MGAPYHHAPCTRMERHQVLGCLSHHTPGHQDTTHHASHIKAQAVGLQALPSWEHRKPRTMWHHGEVSKMIQKRWQKMTKKGSKISVLEPKIEVLEGLEPPWATIWGPRGGGVAVVTFFYWILMSFWGRFWTSFLKSFVQIERYTR